MNETGKFLRKLRIERGGMTLKSMAELMRISSSLLSSYETGRRDISDPEQFIEDAVAALQMSKQERLGLESAVFSTIEKYKLDLSVVDTAHREAYIAFARMLPSLSIEDLVKLKGLGREDKDDGETGSST